MLYAIREAASAHGFIAVGAASAEPFEGGGERLERWLAAGHHGDMGYMAELGAAARADPRTVFPRARSIIVVALPHSTESGGGSVAAYARGEDYHHVMRGKLEGLATELEPILGVTVRHRAVVDTAPLLEREAFARAGLGFVGKNCMAIIPGAGSSFLLGELLVDAELPGAARQKMRCGDCTACLDACPTSAFCAPWVLDSRRCISYLTIEYRGPIPHALRAAIGGRIFGCDVCQDVCPFNKKARAGAHELDPRPALDAPDLEAILLQRSGAYRRLVKGTPLHRASRHQLARNAAVALGNTGDPRSVPALASALAEDHKPLVRGHAAWALGRIGGPEAQRALEGCSADPDELVREEIARAKKAPTRTED